MDDKQVILAIAKEYSGDAERIAATWAECQEVRAKLRSWSGVAGEEIARHEKAMKAIQDQEALVRATCRHWHVVHHVDVAGGNSGFRECDICGEVWW